MQCERSSGWQSEGGGRCATREQAKCACRQQRGRRQLKCRHLGHVLVAWQQCRAAQTAIQRLLRLLAGTASRARHSGGAPKQQLQQWHPIRPGVCAASPPARRSSQGQRLISLTACRGCGSGSKSCSSCCCCAPCCGCGCCSCCGYGHGPCPTPAAGAHPCPARHSQGCGCARPVQGCRGRGKTLSGQLPGTAGAARTARGRHVLASRVHPGCRMAAGGRGAGGRGLQSKAGRRGWECEMLGCAGRQVGAVPASSSCTRHA